MKPHATKTPSFGPSRRTDRKTATHELDARPGDALNIAARTGAPILVDADLINRKGVSSPEEVEPRLTRDLASMRSNDETKRPGEWRSLTKDLLASIASS